MATGDSDNFRPLPGNEFQKTLLSIDEVEDRIHQLIGENISLRNTLQQNNTYMKQLSVSLVEWQDEVVRVQKSYSLKFEKARDLVHKLKNENSELKQKLQLQAAANDDLVRSSNILSNATNRIQEDVPESVPSLISPEPTSSFNLVEVPSMDKPVFCFGPENSFLVVQEPLEMKKNTKELTESENDSEHEIKIRKMQLMNDELMRNVEKLEEKLSSCNARLNKAEEITLKKQSRNTELEIKSSLLEKELETLPILKTQIELYKTDFEAERDARQNLAGEKDAMAQEIRLLKRKLLETSQVAVSTPVAATATLAEPENDANSYICPKCNFNYSSVDSLNNHLDVCLNQHMFP